MPSAYQERERQRQMALHAAGFFGAAPTGGRFFGRERAFVLREGAANLLPEIRDEVQHYFAANAITWWGGGGPSGHLLSSQVACLNHLFPFRRDGAAVTAILRGLFPDVAEALPIPGDAGPVGFLQFEATGDRSWLNEGPLVRGSNCTSLDALAWVLLGDGRRRLVGLEWKYTEHYDNADKVADRTPAAHGRTKGEVRRARYAELLAASGQLADPDLRRYGQEPFYQLLRQTLLLEQLVAHREQERLAAEDWRHLHVVPRANVDLLAKAYRPRGMGMEETWRSLLREQERYAIVDPRDLLAPILGEARYAGILEWLGARYWG